MDSKTVSTQRGTPAQFGSFDGGAGVTIAAAPETPTDPAVNGVPFDGRDAPAGETGDTTCRQTCKD